MTHLRLIPPDPQTHLRAMGQIAADAFAQGQYVDSFCENYIGNSHYDWRVSRLILDDAPGTKDAASRDALLVHHWGVWGYQMRLADTHLRVGGIGAVVTHPNYRQQGLMHRAAQASFAAMQEAGYDMSMLRGRHYAKIGYARAWNTITYRFKLEDFPVGEPPPYFPLGVESIPQMDALYNQTHAAFSGTAIRPTFYNRHPEDISVYAWREDESGALAGYVRAMPAEEDPKTLLCLEAAGDPWQGLAVVGDLYQQGGFEKVACFTLPHSHPMLQLLRQGDCLVESRYFAVSGWRVRIINLASTLQKLLPVFAARLAASRFADWQGSLVLDAGEQQATLHLSQGQAALAPYAEAVAAGAPVHTLRGEAGIARLLIGADEPGEIIQQAEMTCTGLAQPLAQALFPSLHPMLSHWDEY